MASLMLKEAKGKVTEEQISKLIESGATEAAQAEMHARTEASQAAADAVKITLDKALEHQPGLGKRVQETTQAIEDKVGIPYAKWIPGIGEGIMAAGAVGATLRGVLDSAGNYLGMDTTNVRKNALTDTSAMVMGTLDEVSNEGRIQALLEGSGNYQEAKGSLLALGDAVLKNVASHQGESPDAAMAADKNLEAAIVQAKKYIPEQALKGIFETFTKLESTPNISEALEKAQGMTASTNWKEANEESLRLTRLVGHAFNRATSQQGSPAFIREKPADPRAVFARHAGALSLLEDSPEAFLGALRESGIGPKQASKLLEIAQGMATDAASAGKVARMRKEIDERIKSITGRESDVLGQAKRKTGERQLEMIGGAQKRLGEKGLSLPVDRVLGITGE